MLGFYFVLSNRYNLRHLQDFKFVYVLMTIELLFYVLTARS